MENNYKLYVHIAPNGKKYYGITKQEPKKRWNNGKGYKDNQHFTRAIAKYGWDNIDHIILFNDLTESEAKELEQHFIQWYDTANREHGYNISLGGDGSNHSEETKKKMSDSHTGKHHTEGTKQKLRELNQGKHHTEETKQKLSTNRKGKYCAKDNPMYGKGHLITGKNNPMYGKNHTEETKKKMSKNHADYNGKNNPRAKTIICVTTNKIFSTIKDGADYYNINRANISQCCKGQRKSAGKSPTGEKLIWKYIYIEEIV